MMKHNHSGLMGFGLLMAQLDDDLRKIEADLLATPPAPIKPPRLSRQPRREVLPHNGTREMERRRKRMGKGQQS